MKSPAFQFYAADYLADEQVQIMTLEEEGAYIRLLSYCWREGSIPADELMISRLCKGASTTVVIVVRACFNQHPTDNTRLVHKRLDEEREKQQRWATKSSEGGKKSAESKRCNKSRVVQPIGNSSSSFSSSSSSLEPPIVPQGGPVAVPSIKPKAPKQRTAIQQEFHEEWPHYWFKRGKDTAERAYEKARKQATREEIHAAVLLMGPVLLREAQERGHSPLHPATWLNRGGWKDEIAPALAVPGTYPVRDGPRYPDRKARASQEFDARMLEEAKRMGMLNA